MTPLDYYHKQCQAGQIVQDDEQLSALNELQRIYTSLLHEHKKRSGIWRNLRKPRSIYGLYVWGGVGIGKTFLMDCFYRCLPFKEKMRMHFHAFMLMVHQELTKQQGKTDPLKIIAKTLAKKSLVLCFDEFFVTDITDAMILARLLHLLLAEGVCLVLTSNTMPDELYKRGLQRQQFLPAIALLKKHTTVLHLPSTIDYRLRHLKEIGVFFTPDNAAAEEKMQQNFALLAGDAEISHEPLLLCGRLISVKKRTATSIWFDFNVICQPPRSQHDYLELTKQFQTIFISHIPIISANAHNVITLFIRMIDVFYDSHTRLILSAVANVEQLYTEGRLKFEYTRTCSRLREMQSEVYFSRQ